VSVFVKFRLENYSYWSHKYVSSFLKASVVHTCDGGLQGCFVLDFFFCFFVRVASYGGSVRQPELSKLLLVRSSPLGLELGFNILPHAIALYIGYS
jgi:hypothetical protein